MFPLRKMFAKFTRLKFQKFHHLIKFNMTLKFQKFHHFWNKFSKIWKKPWYFTIWTNHFVFSLLLLRRHIPKAKMLSFRYTCIKKFNPVKFFDTFLIIKHVVTTDINTHRIVSNSNIRDSEVKFFLDLVLNALCKRKKKKKRWIVVESEKAEKTRAVLKSEKASRVVYGENIVQLAHQSTEQIKTKSRCQNHAMLCWYFIDQLHCYLYDYIKYNSHSIWT